MRYMINSKTKQHVIVNDDYVAGGVWTLVEADSEGWIAWDCKADLDCPITKYQKYEARLRSDVIVDGVVRWDCYDNDNDVMAYRPILEPVKVQEPEPIPASQYDPRSVSFNLLDRLKAAHEAAQTIPDLEAELRKVLAGMGYDLVARNPFVEPANSTAVVAEPEAAVETPQDMTDWRNWREGDVLECLQANAYQLTIGSLYELLEVTGVKRPLARIKRDDRGEVNGLMVENFRFHNRPSKDNTSHVADALSLATGRPAQGE